MINIFDKESALRFIGLNSSATWRQVMKKYRTLSQVWHPDTTGGAADDEMMKALNNALDILKRHKDDFDPGDDTQEPPPKDPPRDYPDQSDDEDDDSGETGESDEGEDGSTQAGGSYSYPEDSEVEFRAWEQSVRQRVQLHELFQSSLVRGGESKEWIRSYRPWGPDQRGYPQGGVSTGTGHVPWGAYHDFIEKKTYSFTEVLMKVEKDAGSFPTPLHAWAAERELPIPPRNLDPEWLRVKSGKPIIEVKGQQETDLVREIVDHLTPTLDKTEFFRQMGGVIQVSGGGTGFTTSALTNPELSETILSHFMWIETSFKLVKNSNPQQRVIRSVIRALSTALPELHAVRPHPVVDPTDGTLVTKGFIESIGYLVGGEKVTVPAKVSARDIAAFRRLFFDEMLGEFPFRSSMDKVNFLACLIQSIVKPLIDGPTPLYVITAGREGSGKSLLSYIVSMLLTGKDPISQTLPRSEAERKKLLIAVLGGQESICIFDNADGEIRSDSIASTITSLHVGDRRMHSSAIQIRANNVLWLLNGNNCRFSRAIARRVVPIELEIKSTERTSYQIPDLRGWVRSNRKALLDGILLLVKNYLDKGKPAFGGTLLDSFESWSTVLGGVIESAGIEGFLGNLDDFRARSNVEDLAWESLLNAWFHKFGETKVTPGTLAEMIRESKLDAPCRSNGSLNSLATALGIELKNKLGYPIVGYRVSLDDRRHHGKYYSISPVKKPPK